MKKNILFILTALMMFSFVGVINAQEVENLEGLIEEQTIEEAFEIASLEIYNAEIITKEEESKFILSFDFFNKKGVQTDIKYAIQLIRKSERKVSLFSIFNSAKEEIYEVQVVLDEKIYSEKLTLKENETLHKEIEYTVPDYLSGEFDVWIIAKNSNGVLLSIANPGKINFNGTNEFIEIVSESCYLKVQGDNKEYNSMEGVSVNNNENLQIVCEVVNHYNKKINFTPYFNTYYRSTFGELVKENESIQSDFEIEANEIKTFSFDIPKVDISQAYEAKLFFKDGNNTISNPSFFHYVIQGESATIQNLSLDKDYYLEGEMANVSVYITPSADIFSDSRSENQEFNDINVMLSIYDGKDNLCSNNSYEKLINDENREVQNFSVEINRDCYDPKVVVKAENSLGNILAQREYQVKTEAEVQTKAEAEIDNYRYVFPLIFLCLLIILIFFLIKKKMIKINLLLFLILIISFSVFLIPEKADAGTFVVKGKSTSSSYAYRWQVNSCPDLNPRSSATSCYINRTWPLGPKTFFGGNCYRILSSFGLSGYCSGGYFIVIPGFDWMYAADATYTVNLNKTTFRPGETMVLNSSAYGSYCANGIWAAYLVLYNSATNQWTRIIDNDGTGSSIPTLYRTNYLTAPSAPGTYSLTFYGSAYRGHDSTGVIGMHTVTYTVVAPTAACPLPWGGTIPHGSSVTAYQSSSVSCGSNCSSQTRTCNNGTLSGSYTNRTCSVQNCTPTASIDSPASNQTIYTGQSVYFNGHGNDSDGSITHYEWRLNSCTGTLQSSNKSFTKTFPTAGTYRIYFRVRDNSGAWSTNCPSRLITVLNRAPTLNLSASPNPVNHNTASTLSWNSNYTNSCTASGAWSGAKSTSGSQSTGNLTSTKTYTLTCTGPGGSVSKSVTVNVGSPAACPLPWGGTIPHGSSVTAYQSSSVSCGSSCSSQTRTCNNGTLSGSYRNKTCSVQNCAPTASITKPASNQTIYTGQSVKFNGHGNDSDGNITHYQWRISSCTGTLQSSSKSFTKTFPTAGTYRIYFRVRDNSGAWSTNCPSRLITVLNRNLSVSLSTSASSGYVPLNVNLTATVGGNETGTINYTFYCNRSDSGTNITPGYIAKYDGVSNTSRTATCNYTSPGTYTAKVIVERGSSVAEARQTITVSNPPCNCSSWINQGCGVSPCAINEMKRTRTCTPSGCDTEIQCLPSSACQHKECDSDNKCVTIPGPGTDECNNDGDCTIPLPGWEEVLPW